MADKILIVDDDPDLRSELRDFLDGYEVIEASNGLEALALLDRANEIVLVILDIMMPGINGLEVLTKIKNSELSPAIIILTGYSSKDIAVEALKGHADDYIEKPVQIEKLSNSVKRLLKVTSIPNGPPLPGIEGAVEKTKRFIERNCYKKITLEEASKAVGLEPKYLSRMFKQCAKTGFSDYKLTIKINKSKELLKARGYKIKQIARKLGYENAESFIRQFKKITGHLPTEYRRMIAKPGILKKVSRR
ncbi:MAG: response regulator [Candidatus Omnitrophica bacterium]|nr:response regulator [Candidatus Omnitrophota bacterium]